MICPNCNANLAGHEFERCPFCQQELTVPQTKEALLQEPPPAVSYRRYKRVRAEKAGRTLVGWLIRSNDEEQLLCYPIYEGINTIGRPSATSRPDLPIDDDEYVSRMHCMCKVTKTDQQWECHVSDDGYPGDRPSINGIYLNGSPDRISEYQPSLLKDGDTLQVGMTKLVFKTQDTVTSEADAVAKALEVEAVPTIEYKV